MGHFNPRPPCGGRPGIRFRKCEPGDFNPRPPCGGRRGQIDKATKYLISIHGPRVGADLSVPAVPSSWPHFNPRPPCGGRPPRPAPPRASRGFQSTAPVWGPTVAAALVRLPAEFQSTAPVWGPTHAFVWLPGTAVISIHGPRVGADRCICSPFLQAAYFNPRPPCGGRRQAFPSSRCPVQFQSTAPVWGPTRSSRRKLCFHCNFNPRPPCGGRHTISNNIRLLFEFQSTAPVWGPTSVRLFPSQLPRFQSTAPVWGPTV